MMENQPGREIMEKYPEIFREMDMSKLESCMYWGLAIGDGWQAHVDSVCALIQELSNRTGVKLIAVQVKEKFGGLRFYYSLEFPEDMEEKKIDWLTKRFDGLVQVMEALCSFTCEECGKDGTTAGSTGWVKCLCGECREKEKRERSSW